jgi:hypothetical protein
VWPLKVTCHCVDFALSFPTCSAFYGYTRILPDFLRRSTFFRTRTTLKESTVVKTIFCAIKIFQLYFANISIFNIHFFFAPKIAYQFVEFYVTTIFALYKFYFPKKYNLKFETKLHFWSLCNLGEALKIGGCSRFVSKFKSRFIVGYKNSFWFFEFYSNLALNFECYSFASLFWTHSRWTPRFCFIFVNVLQLEGDAK